MENPAQNLATTKADIYQSPPALTTEVAPELHAATQGAALSYAKNLSHRASVLSGSIAATLVGIAMIPAHASGRALKIISGTVLGGGLGYVIGNMPWQTAQPLPPPQQQSAPEVAIATPTHNGKIEPGLGEVRSV